MWINSVRELGQLVREYRTRLGLSQAALAAKIGTTRHWVIGLERGKPTVELERVLNALFAMGLGLYVAAPGAMPGIAPEATAVSREIPTTKAKDRA